MNRQNHSGKVFKHIIRFGSISSSAELRQAVQATAKASSCASHLLQICYFSNCGDEEKMNTVIEGILKILMIEIFHSVLALDFMFFIFSPFLLWLVTSLLLELGWVAWLFTMIFQHFCFQSQLGSGNINMCKMEIGWQNNKGFDLLVLLKVFRVQFGFVSSYGLGFVFIFIA